MPVTPNRIDSLSVMSLMERREKAKTASRFGNETTVNIFEVLAVGFQTADGLSTTQHFCLCVCVCGKTCEAERDGICWPGSPTRVDVPLSLRLPTAPVNTPFFLSRVVILLFFFLSCSLYYGLLRKLSQIPLSSCWRDNVHGSWRRAASLHLPRWQLNAACLLDSFFSQTGDLR